MARLDSWLSADVMHALGWALIHSLWQCLGLAALAAVLTAFSRRPSIRYLVATFTLVAMLAAPVATFFVLMRPAAPAVHALIPANLRPQFFAARGVAASSNATSINPSAATMARINGAATILNGDRKSFLPSRLLSPAFLPPNILPWLVGAWLCGVALFSLRFAGGFLLLEHRRRRQFTVPGPRILALCQELQRQLGLDRAIRYLECGWLQAPAVIGWIRPIVLLPVWALTGLSEAQLRAVIAHELAHIRRLDAFVNLLQILVETLLFYHPAIWWLNKRIRAERELCCDEIAISLTGDRMAFAQALTLMAEWEQAPALAMAANRGPLSQRVFHILGKKPFGAGQRMLGLTGSILFLAAALGAANALFGIAYPITAAHAKVSPKAARTAVDPVAQQANDAVSNQRSGDDATDQKTPAAVRTDTMASIRAEKLVASPPDVSQLLSMAALALPTLVALNDPPAAAAQKAVARTCAVPAIADKVGLKDVPGSDLMTVPVAINGTPRQFLLDFGTNPSEVSETMAAELHLPQPGQNIAAGPNSSLPLQAPLFDVKGAGSATDYQARVHIASFTIGSATVKNLEFLVANDRDLGKSKPYDGLLTTSDFPQYDIDFDFGGKALSFLAPTNCTDPNQVAYWPHTAVAVVPMTLSSGKMQVQVTIQGHVIDAVIDTGSAHTVMRRDIAEMVFGLHAADMTQEGDVLDGNGQQVYRYTFPQISFAGGVTANNVPALIQTDSMVRKINKTPILGSRAQFAADPSARIPDLALGMDMLHQLHLYAAFDENKLYVTSAESALYVSSAK